MNIRFSLDQGIFSTRRSTPPQIDSGRVMVWLRRGSGRTALSRFGAVLRAALKNHLIKRKSKMRARIFVLNDKYHPYEPLGRSCARSPSAHLQLLFQPLDSARAEITYSGEPSRHKLLDGVEVIPFGGVNQHAHCSRGTTGQW